MSRPDYQDGTFVMSIAGSPNDRGSVIGFGYRKDGLAMLMVERPDKTVFAVPEVQMTPIYNVFDGWHETLIHNHGVESRQTINRVSYRRRDG